MWLSLGLLQIKICSIKCYKTLCTDFFKKSVLEPLTNVIKFAKDKQEMAPHLTAHLVPGHTPGLIILKLELDGKILWFYSDIFHIPLLNYYFPLY